MSTFTTDFLVSLVTHSPWTDAEISDMSRRPLADTGLPGKRPDTVPPSWQQRLLASVRAIAHRSTPEEKAFRQAVRELQSYSDTELAGLGIARCDIERAVRYGRPGVDYPERTRLAA